MAKEAVFSCIARAVTAHLREASSWLSVYRSDLRRSRHACVVSTSYSNVESRAAATAAAEQGITSIYIQHGLFPVADVYCHFLHKRLFVWGKHQATAFTNRGTPRDAVSLIGPMLYDRFDFSAPPLSHRDGKKRVVLMASRSGGVATSEELARLTIQAISGAFKDVPDAELTIKVHPGDNTRVPEEASAKLPNVRVVRNVSSQSLTIDSDLVIVVSSTTAYEACLAGRPLIVANFSGLEDFTEVVDMGAALRVTDPSQFADTLQKALSSDSDRDLEAGRARVISEMLGDYDGQATKATAAAIESVLASF